MLPERTVAAALRENARHEAPELSGSYNIEIRSTPLCRTRGTSGAINIALPAGTVISIPPIFAERTPSTGTNSCNACGRWTPPVAACVR